jgi:glutaredoxin-like protein
MPELFNDSIKQQVREALEKMKNPVEILLFSSQENCDYCRETRQLCEDVVTLSNKLSLRVYDIHADAAIAKKFNVDKTPGLVIVARDGKKVTDYGVRYAGIPSGHEFNSLIQDILLVSVRDSGLNESTREFLRALAQPVTLQVFVTPT